MTVQVSPTQKVHQEAALGALGQGTSWTDGLAISVYEPRQLELPACVLTIGAFDGVHRGHQALVERTVARAAQLSVPSVAYTFDPPPKVLFQGERLLTSPIEKIRRLQAAGLDYVVMASFNTTYAATVLCQEGLTISSSRVRDLLAAGDIHQAQSLLGWST